MAAKLDSLTSSPKEAAVGQPGVSLGRLDMTQEELERFKAAFQDQEFRKMFTEYVEELNDPETRRRYEEEIRLLERERGVDLQFVYPSPGYVLLTSANRLRRCYINVCSNGVIPKPQAVRGTDQNAREGSHWTLPYLITPTRETTEQDGSRSLLYDVLFHPETMELVSKNVKFKQMVDSLAMSGVSKYFSLELDRINVKTLSAKYMGPAQSAVIRKPIPGFVPNADTPAPLEGPYPYTELLKGGTGRESPAARPKPSVHPKQGVHKPRAPRSPPTTPHYTIRQRSHVDFQDYTLSRFSAPSPVPDELVVTVDMPLLESASSVSLHILSKQLHLESKEPVYKLQVDLPYMVDENRGNAQFNKAKRQLVLTLPVVRQNVMQCRMCQARNYGTWDNRSRVSVCPHFIQSVSQLPQAITMPRFCQPNNTSYHSMQHILTSPDVLCPVFTCTQDNTSLSVILHTQDVDKKSVQVNVEINQFHISYRVKHGYTYYFLLIQFLPKYCLNRNELSINVTEKNAVVELAKSPENFGLWKNLYFGDNRNPLQERKFVYEDNVAEFLESSSQGPQVPWSTLEDELLLEVLELNDQQAHIQPNKSEEEDPLPQQEVTNHVEAEDNTISESSQTSTTNTCPIEKDDQETWQHTSNINALNTAEQTTGSIEQPEPSLNSADSKPGETISPEVESTGDLCVEKRSSIAKKDEPVEEVKDVADQKQITAQNESDTVPILKEVDEEDGHVEVIKDHSTQCAFTFQNPLLFDLD
ncbi:protein kintoun [Pelobates fuscus]|uniref:protein kintoun n=1 Tax=Pelobates fuscus TaxID=191477 RepID=UPI002FE4F270